MNAALLRDPVEIHELVVSKTEYGTVNKSYRYKCRTKAFVQFDSESQVVSEGEIYYPINKTFIVRAYIPVVETDAVKFEDKMWKVISINKNKHFNNIEIKTTLLNQ